MPSISLSIDLIKPILGTYPSQNITFNLKGFLTDILPDAQIRVINDSDSNRFLAIGYSIAHDDLQVILDFCQNHIFRNCSIVFIKPNQVAEVFKKITHVAQEDYQIIPIVDEGRLFVFKHSSDALVVKLKLNPTLV